ncbi:hypothetical protein LDENG_00077170, partial [Lucifuga dentata]
MSKCDGCCEFVLVSLHPVIMCNNATSLMVSVTMYSSLGNLCFVTLIGVDPRVKSLY